MACSTGREPVHELLPRIMPVPLKGPFMAAGLSIRNVVLPGR